MGKCRLPECQTEWQYAEGYCRQHYENLKSWIDPNWVSPEEPPKLEDIPIRLPLQLGGGLEPPPKMRKRTWV